MDENNEYHSIIKENLLDLKQKDKNCAVFILGSTCSGKSTVKKLYMSSLGKDISKFIDIDSDNVIEKMDSYKQLLKNNPLTAAQLSYQKALNIVNKIYDYTKQNKYNFILNGTGKDYNYMSEEIKHLKTIGYEIYLCIVIVNNIDIILKRCIKRALKTKRIVPTTIIISSYNILKKNIPKYKSIDILSDLTIYNNTYKPKIIYKKNNLLKNIDYNIYKKKNKKKKSKSKKNKKKKNKN